MYKSFAESVEGCGFNPVQVGGDTAVNARFARLGAVEPPRYDSDDRPLILDHFQHQRPSRIALDAKVVTIST